jgi:hypothetical protein
MSEPDNNATRVNIAIENMRIYGGNFVRNLAACWLSADSANRFKIETSFHEYFDTYAKFHTNQPK